MISVISLLSLYGLSSRGLRRALKNTTVVSYFY